MYMYIYIYTYDDKHMFSRNWKLLEEINSENLLSESDLGLRLKLLNGFFSQSIAGSKNCQDFDECPLGHH